MLLVFEQPVASFKNGERWRCGGRGRGRSRGGGEGVEAGGGGVEAGGKGFKSLLAPMVSIARDEGEFRKEK